MHRKQTVQGWITTVVSVASALTEEEGKKAVWLKPELILALATIQCWPWSWFPSLAHFPAPQKKEASVCTHDC